MKTQRTIDCFIEDMIEQLKGSIKELDRDDSDIAFGQRLAYIECLEIIKGEIAGDEEKFGLDGDLEKKFGLFSKTYKTKNSN